MTPLFVRAILHNMAGLPIQLVVNYWEIPNSGSKKLSARLDDLLRRGVTNIATYIPWQAVESDISHTLTRFLLAAVDRKMSVTLILTPEVGVHYPNSGLPKDVLSKKENIAQHSRKGKSLVHLPPNNFALPSHLAPEFSKRYNSFLARMDGLLADFKRVHLRSLDDVTVVLTGSFWKYYRAPVDSSRDFFGGVSGDFSAPAMLDFRQKVENYYSTAEYCDPTPAAGNRWKTRAMEQVNLRWFYQKAEAAFRQQTFQSMRRKTSGATVREIELFTPEADPGLFYSNFLQTLSGGKGDFFRLSQALDEMASFSSQACSSPASNFVHWSSLGGFRSLSDSEKQFLILKSLLLMGGAGGGIFIDEEEWFALSPAFRSRAEAFARAISQGELRLRGRALYLTPHLWSSSGLLWKELRSRLGPEARLISSLDLLDREKDASVLVVDPSYVFTRETIQKLVSWARAGRVVVLPRSSLYTEIARSELELIAAGSKKIEIDLGIRYRLHSLGDGTMIVHELDSDSATAWQSFLTAVLSLAEIESYCKISDSRLLVIPLAKRDASLGLFVMNSTRRQVSADIVFPHKVIACDLALSITANSAAEASVAPAHRFALDVPPCGVMPLSVRGLDLTKAEERVAAAKLSASTQKSAAMAAVSALPGLPDSDAEGDLWG